ncbi:hypothetical protein ASD88_26255 [Pelomonas sp. Root662]|nr:hypothetical protein ASC81_26275 [Pelomonas sp. Root405]KRA75377.1 hypothetical protein ASD88_26255 [Pelomonas sp. Root662]
MAQRQAGAFRSVAHRAGAGVQAAARFGQAQAARAAGKQGQADSGFDGRNSPADSGARQAEIPRRLREAAGLCDAGEKFKRISV